MQHEIRANRDTDTVNGFGKEWHRYDQSGLTSAQQQMQFSWYFSEFPWETLPKDAIGFDMGCGSGRWAQIVSSKVKRVLAIDASISALRVAHEKLQQTDSYCIQGSFEGIPLRDKSMDFGYCLGVLHHIPDTVGGLKACVAALKPGAPFLIYMYYAFDNKPVWYKYFWVLSDITRKMVCRFPFWAKTILAEILAALVYYPLARIALLASNRGINVSNWLLSAYKNQGFYSMRTDAMDRFGTKLEKRFTKKQIVRMMTNAGLQEIVFREGIPYWCAIGIRSS